MVSYKDPDIGGSSLVLRVVKAQAATRVGRPGISQASTPRKRRPDSQLHSKGDKWHMQYRESLPAAARLAAAQ